MRLEPEGRHDGLGTDAPVRITTETVYHAVLALQEQVAAVQRTLAVSQSKADTIEGRTFDHETRLRSLEQKVWAIPGFAVLVALASIVVTIFVAL